MSRLFASFLLTLFTTLPSFADAGDNPAPGEQPVRLPVTRDNWFSEVGSEADGNNGGDARIKLKAIQEMSLIDIDPRALKGRVVRSATLHLRLAGNERLHRVTVSSFGAEWVEGTSTGYKPQKGSSTFNHRRHPDVPWTVRGSDLTSVMLGQGGTLWRMADAFPPDKQGWQKVAIDPAVVAARVAGISYGFLLFDDTGSEWTRDGEKFTFRLFPNRFVRSREAGAASAPYLTVALGAEDHKAPAAPTDLNAETGKLPAGEAWVTWRTPRDQGEAGTLGFFATVDGKEVPRYLLPLAGKPGERVRMHLRDLGLRAGAKVEIAVRAVDGAGNVGPAATADITVSEHVAAELPGVAPKPFTAVGPLPRLGEAEVAILDELDKVLPDTGTMVPRQPKVYLNANHLWNARDRYLRLHAARNEFVSFQVLLRGAVEGVEPELSFEGREGAKIKTTFGRYGLIPSEKGPLPDPIVPLDGAVDVDAGKSVSLHGEVYVPHDVGAGNHKGKLILKAGDDKVTITVNLRVWNFTLPDYLSFLPDMNCYGLPANERAYYRLAHRHRTVLNKVPYSQSGAMGEGCAPRWDGKRLDWKAWDRRFGPYFDGSAFADLPRRGVPLECFYLPLFENWPTSMAGNYNGSYWADRAFPKSYRADFVEVARQMAEHCNAKNWNDTLFQGFLNNKVDFKRNGWSRGSSPWLLDEPASYQDYWALRYFGKAFHEGYHKAPGKAKMVFRCDISRPQWQRDTFDGLLDYNVVGGAVRRYRRMVMDRKEQNGEVVVEYGGTNALDASNVQPLGWSIDSWALGTDGVLPWQTIGNAGSWKKPDALSLFYPAEDGKGGDPVPSVRLKAYRRGQQDVEYLTLLGLVKREPRWALGQRVREALRLAPVRKGTGFVGEDAGIIHFARLLPQDAWALRLRVGGALDEAAPKPKRRLVDLRTPARDLSHLTPGYVSTGEFPEIIETPEGVSGVAKVLQGRQVVRDVLLDPDRPVRKLGSESRSNALRKGNTTSVFLVRFDLDQLKLPKKTKVQRARVHFYVWDPSSQGNTKLTAFAVTTPWNEDDATFRQPGKGKFWKKGRFFATGSDTGPAGKQVVVKPDQGSDTVEPPLEYTVDVTDFVRAWLDGRAANHGLALVPVPDRSIDEGNFTRFQIYASEYNRPKYTPKLTIELAP